MKCFAYHLLDETAGFVQGKNICDAFDRLLDNNINASQLVALYESQGDAFHRLKIKQPGPEENTVIDTEPSKTYQKPVATTFENVIINVAYYSLSKQKYDITTLVTEIGKILRKHFPSWETEIEVGELNCITRLSTLTEFPNSDKTKLGNIFENAMCALTTHLVFREKCHMNLTLATLKSLFIQAFPRWELEITDANIRALERLNRMFND